MNKKLALYISFFLFCISIQSVFGASGVTIDLKSASEKPQTLREMQETNQDLEQEQQNLEFKWTTFRNSSGLGNLIKEDLPDFDKQILEGIIIRYTKKLAKGERRIVVAGENIDEIKELRKEILLLKQEFYKKLIVYIQIEKLSDFTKYINSDLSYREKSKDIALQIDQQSIERNERVEEIQERIKDNTIILRRQIEERITQRVGEKLDFFISEEKFQKLSNTMKINVFEKLIKKLSGKSLEIKNTLNPTSVIKQKILLYEVVEDILYGYLKKWK